MKRMFLAAASLATLASCLDSAPNDPQVETTDRIVLNSLLPGDLHTTTLGNAALTTTAIHSLASTTSGRNYLTYVVGCALAPTQSVTAIELGGNYTFTGVLGMTTAWTTRALTATERAQVTECVMSRTNYFGDTISISDRGINAALYTTDQELSSYGVEEGAFFGDILGGSTNLYACIGVDQAHDDTQSDLPYRKCATATSYCGFNNIGNCADVCTGRDSSGAWTGCGQYNFSDGVINFLNGTPD